MVGKTAAEVARTSAALVTNAATSFERPAAPTPQYSTPAAAQPGSLPQAPDPQLMYSDPARYQQELFAFQNAALQQTLSQTIAPIYQQNAQFALSSAKRGTYSEVWKRYEPEILGELQNVDRRMWNEPLLDKAAEIVQGRHWRDFAAEEVRRLQENGGGLERTSQGGGAPSPSQGDALDQAWESDHPYFVRAREAKLSKSDMRAHIKEKLKLPVDQFVKNITSQQVISTERGFTRETY